MAYPWFWFLGIPLVFSPNTTAEFVVDQLQQRDRFNSLPCTYDNWNRFWEFCLGDARDAAKGGVVVFVVWEPYLSWLKATIDEHNAKAEGDADSPFLDYELGNLRNLPRQEDSNLFVYQTLDLLFLKKDIDKWLDSPALREFILGLDSKGKEIQLATPGKLVIQQVADYLNIPSARCFAELKQQRYGAEIYCDWHYHRELTEADETTSRAKRAIYE